MVICQVSTKPNGTFVLRLKVEVKDIGYAYIIHLCQVKVFSALFSVMNPVSLYVLTRIFAVPCRPCSLLDVSRC